MLKDLGITSVKISSGFRTLAANKAAGGANKSLHMDCKAIDFEDFYGEIDHKVEKNFQLLDKYQLWLENPEKTPSWSHWDIGNRTKRAKRIFTP